ncbi:MAG TPA: hydroxyisourate hydrolase, partial [Acidimicrobiia bacterium]|nr:hydroxyisourate hydrolase [Acidimicrobiia bacterium]
GNVFYPQVHIVVSLDEEQDHYHIPLLLSPYGYTTYRGR